MNTRSIVEHIASGTPVPTARPHADASAQLGPLCVPAWLVQVGSFGGRVDAHQAPGSGRRIAHTWITSNRAHECSASDTTAHQGNRRPEPGIVEGY